jgi:hypothetical protein
MIERTTKSQNMLLQVRLRYFYVLYSVSFEVTSLVEAVLAVAVTDVDDVVVEHLIVTAVVHLGGVGLKEKVVGDVVPF